MMVSNGNVTALAAGLAADGLVERRAEAADRRVQRLCLTPYGQHAFEIQSEEHERWIAELFADIPSTDRATLHRLLGVAKSGVRKALAEGEADEPEHLQSQHPAPGAIVLSKGERAMTDLTVLQPPGWPSPKGYSNGVAGTGRIAMIGGQIGWDEQGNFPEGFVAQVAQALRNVVAGARGRRRSEHIAAAIWYVVDIEAYRLSLPRLGAAYRDTLGRWYPAMTLVQVTALVEREALVEIEATAIFELVDIIGRIVPPDYIH